MKIDIKHIINDPGSEGEHWLADAVETGDGSDKTRGNAARERQDVPDLTADTEAAGLADAGSAAAVTPEMPGTGSFTDRGIIAVYIYVTASSSTNAAAIAAIHMYFPLPPSFPDGSGTGTAGPSEDTCGS